MADNEAAARRLLATVPFYTEEVQTDRRAMVRRKAHVAAQLLGDAICTADPDELAALVIGAEGLLGEAIAEIMRASLR